ncbi:hypothetical protein AB0D67_37780 [Streptosporangium sp. NPDC048047]|uniref:hypothetical protein n=1 Tax=Streptosporangium sp. NPDC048047 TaxID=3155748 RepID=UPI0034159220
MDIISLVMTGAGGVGVGTVLGAMVLRPRVGPWRASGPACPCASRPAATEGAMAVAIAPHHAALTHQLAYQISPIPTVTPDSLESAYVNTARGLVPVLVNPAALAPAVPAADRTLPAPGEIAGGSQ